MAEGRASSEERTSALKSRIPRLQRSVSIQDQLNRRRSSFSPPSQPRRSSMVGKPSGTNDEELEALDSFSLSSIGSAVSCCVPTNSSSYMAALQSSHERRIRTAKPFKFTLHCHTPTSCNPSEYLTPTQRANLTIRRLRTMLTESQAESQYKDFEIQRLTKELVELRLEHAQCVKKTHITPASPEVAVNGPSPSLADSGHFDDLNLINGRHSSKESLAEKEMEAANVIPVCPIAVQGEDDSSWALEKRRLITFHIEQLNDLKRQHTDEVQTIRGRLTDRLEQALEQLGESNTRYANLMSSYDRNRDQLNAAEAELKTLRETLTRHEQLIARLQSELDERETQEYEIREKEIIEIDSLNKEMNAQKLRVEELESEVHRLKQENQQLNSTCHQEADQVHRINQPESEIDRLVKNEEGNLTNNQVLRIEQLESDVDRLNQENLQLQSRLLQETNRLLRIEQLESEVNQLRQENQTMQADQKQNSEFIHLRELGIEDSRYEENLQLKSTVQQSNDHVLRIKHLESEVNRLTLEKQLRPLVEEESEPILRLRHLESEIDRLSQENERLQSTLQQENDQMHLISQLKSDVARLSQDNLKLHTLQLQNEQTLHIKQLESEIDRLNQENKRLSISSKQDPTDGADSMTSVMEQLKAATAELDKFKEINNKKEVDSGDAAVTLKFLRSAVFYLLTDHDNIGNHLRAVQNILDFSAEERAAVERLLRHGYFL